eukprot:11610330-Alexandrium_andersonii.AAC.1
MRWICKERPSISRPRRLQLCGFQCQRPPSPRKGLLVASPGRLPPPGPPDWRIRRARGAVAPSVRPLALEAP